MLFFSCKKYKAYEKIVIKERHKKLYFSSNMPPLIRRENSRQHWAIQ